MSEDFDYDGLFDDIDDEQVVWLPEECVTIRSTAGGEYQVPLEADETKTIQQVLSQAQLTVSSDIEYWVGGITVNPNFVVSRGTVINAVGRVKGG